MTFNRGRGWAFAGLLVAVLVASGQVTAPAAAGSGRPAGSAGGVGARVPFTEYQAEDTTTNGTVIGPDRAYGTLAAEAVGRKAVQLDKKGQYVEFTLKKPANAVNVRYSIPDTADGVGRDASLGVYVNSRRVQSLSLTSRYSWYYGQYPWTNNPADGGRRQLYDDSRVMLGSTLPAGTKVRLQMGSVDTSPWYVIDVADFEKVAAAAQAPRHSLSVIDYGADKTGAQDSSDAIQAAIDAASSTGRTVWIPKGRFKVTRHLIVDRVTMRGAGPWYSILTGDGVGVYGGYNPTPSSDVHLSDFAIFGEVKERVDAAQLNAIGGALNNSEVDNLWLQHTKVGVWVDGPLDNLTVSRARILDQTADGLNFHDGVTNSKVVDTYVRNTGDDGLAMWSDNHPDTNNTFTRNTVKVPVLANNIAIYGGTDNKVTNNLGTDTVTQGGGIQIANRFNAVPLAGTTTVAGNELIRTGTLDLFSHIGNGALWFWAGDAPLTGNVDVRNNLIQDSSYEAIQFYGQPISNVTFNRNIIDKAGTFAVQLNTSGSAASRKTVASGLGAGGVYDCDSGFTIIDRGGNRGWSDTTCGYPAPGPLNVTNLGETLQFSTGEIGTASDPQTVTITNPTSKSVRIASVTITGAYTVSDTCGSKLAAGASCTATIRFVPTPRGDRSGALTISDGTPAGRYQVYVRGEVIASTVGNLAAGRPVIASSEITGCCAASNATDSNTDTYWESANNAFPQTLAVDLGTAVNVSRLVFKINPGWGGSRTQTFEILASSDGSNYTTVIPAADYTFDSSANSNTVTINLPATIQKRYIQVKVTGNTGWPAAQIAEFEVYAA